MHIQSITLRNFACFYGVHQIDLEPGVYGVLARHNSDSKRSNWLGKSTFLEAIPYALFGTFPRKRYRTENELITTGETSAYVMLTLSDGTEIKRIRADKTTLQVRREGETLTGEIAQTEIYKILGLTSQDFYASCYVEQRELAKFVLCDPSERLAIVYGWLGVEPLVRAETQAKHELGEIRQSLESSEKRLASLKERITDAAVSYGLTAHPDFSRILEDARKKVTSLEQKVSALESVATQDLALEEQRLAYVKHLQGATHYQNIAGDIERYSGELASLPAHRLKDAQGEQTKRLEDHIKAKRRLEEIAPLAEGTFGGTCPLLPSFECPAKGAILGAVAEHKQAREQAKAEVAAKAHSLSEATSRVMDETRIADRKAYLETRLVSLKEQLAHFQESADYIATHDNPGPPSEERKEALWHAKEALKAWRDFAGKWLPSSIATYETALTQVKVLRSQVSTAQRACVVLGKNGAQRRLAEKGLAWIETQTNRILEDAQIPLTVSVSWGRESGGVLTPVCEGCGAEYGTSQRLKSCPHCGTHRGPKIIHRLTLDLSDRSGAAEDLAGVAFQLAACAYLRQLRSSIWGVALLDEPFGQLDPHNRHALTQHLSTTLIQGFGFDQVFLVAHTPGLLEALPHQIVITSDSGISQLEAR